MYKQTRFWESYCNNDTVHANEQFTPRLHFVGRQRKYAQPHECHIHNQFPERQERPLGRRSAASKHRSCLRNINQLSCHRATFQGHTDELPAILLDVVQVDGVTGECISVTGSVDTTPAELLSLRIGQIPSVALVEHTVRKRATRANGEQVALQACSIRVDVEDCRALNVTIDQHVFRGRNDRMGRTVLSQPQIIVPYTELY